jgi:NhaP-type Na+/H+ or K+/H+ antiporter
LSALGVFQEELLYHYTQNTPEKLWEFVAFFVTSIVFLLVGDQIRFEVLQNNWATIALRGCFKSPDLCSLGD